MWISRLFLIVLLGYGIQTVLGQDGNSQANAVEDNEEQDLDVGENPANAPPTNTTREGDELLSQSLIPQLLPPRTGIAPLDAFTVIFPALGSLLLWGSQFPTQRLLGASPDISPDASKVVLVLAEDAKNAVNGRPRFVRQEAPVPPGGSAMPPPPGSSPFIPQALIDIWNNPQVGQALLPPNLSPINLQDLSIPSFPDVNIPPSLVTLFNRSPVPFIGAALEQPVVAPAAPPPPNAESTPAAEPGQEPPVPAAPAEPAPPAGPQQSAIQRTFNQVFSQPLPFDQNLNPSALLGSVQQLPETLQQLNPADMFPPDFVSQSLSNLQQLNFAQILQSLQPAGAASDISEVRVTPDGGRVEFDQLNPNTQFNEDRQTKNVPLLWFRLPQNQKSDDRVHFASPGSTKSLEDLKIESKLQAFERQVIAELKMLQEIERLAKEMRANGKSNGERKSLKESTTSPYKLSYPLSKTPVHKITRDDIERALRDDYVRGLLQLEAQRKVEKKQHGSDKSIAEESQTTKRQAKLSKEDIIKMMAYAYRMANENGEPMSILTGDAGKKFKQDKIYAAYRASQNAAMNKPDQRQWLGDEKHTGEMNGNQANQMAGRQWVESLPKDEHRQWIMNQQQQAMQHNSMNIQQRQWADEQAKQQQQRQWADEQAKQQQQRQWADEQAKQQQQRQWADEQVKQQQQQRQWADEQAKQQQQRQWADEQAKQQQQQRQWAEEQAKQQQQERQRADEQAKQQQQQRQWADEQAKQQQQRQLAEDQAKQQQQQRQMADEQPKQQQNQPQRQWTEDQAKQQQQRQMADEQAKHQQNQPQRQWAEDKEMQQQKHRQMADEQGKHQENQPQRQSADDEANQQLQRQWADNQAKNQQLMRQWADEQAKQQKQRQWADDQTKQQQLHRQMSDEHCNQQRAETADIEVKEEDKIPIEDPKSLLDESDPISQKKQSSTDPMLVERKWAEEKMNRLHEMTLSQRQRQWADEKKRKEMQESSKNEHLQPITSEQRQWADDHTGNVEKIIPQKLQMVDQSQTNENPSSIQRQWAEKVMDKLPNMQGPAIQQGQSSRQLSESSTDQTTDSHSTPVIDNMPRQMQGPMMVVGEATPQMPENAGKARFKGRHGSIDSLDLLGLGGNKRKTVHRHPSVVNYYYNANSYGQPYSAGANYGGYQSSGGYGGGGYGGGGYHSGGGYGGSRYGGGSSGYRAAIGNEEIEEMLTEHKTIAKITKATFHRSKTDEDDTNHPKDAKPKPEPLPSKSTKQLQKSPSLVTSAPSKSSEQLDPEIVGSLFSIDDYLLLPYMGLEPIYREDDPWNHKAFDLHYPIFTGGGSYESYLREGRYKRDTHIMSQHNLLTSPGMLERLLRIKTEFQRKFPQLYKSMLESHTNRTRVAVKPPVIPKEVSYPIHELGAAEKSPYDLLLPEDLKEMAKTESIDKFPNKTKKKPLSKEDKFFDYFNFDDADN